MTDKSSRADEIISQYHPQTERLMALCCADAKHIHTEHRGEMWSILPELLQWCAAMRVHMRFEELDLFPRVIEGTVSREEIAAVERDHSAQLGRLALFRDRAVSWSGVCAESPCRRWMRLADTLRELQALTLEHVASEEMELFR